jgi:hypothetical protein
MTEQEQAVLIAKRILASETEESSYTMLAKAYLELRRLHGESTQPFARVGFLDVGAACD